MAGIALPADVFALFLLVPVKAFCGADGKIAVLYVHMELIFLEAGHVHVNLESLVQLTHIGLHKISSVLAVQRVAALVCGHHAEGFVKEFIKQIFTKNHRQHKSFLHSNRLVAVREAPRVGELLLPALCLFRRPGRSFIRGPLSRFGFIIALRLALSRGEC